MNPAFASEREWVRQAVESTWQREAQLHFSRWNACDWYLWTNPQVRIRVADEGPHTSNLGTLMGHEYGGMTLNFTFRNWSPSCQSMRQFCIQAIAVHEFGHALSFAHEQNRPDKPAWCSDVQRQGPGGDWVIGPWDASSVMNYCNTNWNNGGKLSPGDIAGVQTVYGKRSSSIVGINGLCLGAPRGPGSGTTMEHCSNVPDQRWMMTLPRSFPTRLMNLRGYVLDAWRGQDTNGTMITEWNPNLPVSANQQWRFQDVAIKAIGGKCIDIPNSRPGTLVQLLGCNGGPGQQWTFTEAGEIRSSNGQCLDASGGSSTDGTPVGIWPCHGGANQKWSWDSRQGLVGIGGKCLDAWGGSWDDGTALALFRCHGGLNQRFSVLGLIRTAQASGRCINAATSYFDPRNPDLGSPVLYNCIAGDYPAQTWEFFP
jgi:hypothetical protein